MIGREFETHVMKKLLDIHNAKLLAILGRRQVFVKGTIKT